METQYTRLSMTPSGVPPVIYMSQNDIGRPIGFICDADLSDYSVVLEGTRTDGTPITVAVTVDGNICAFETTATMTNKADVYIVQIVVTNASGKHISSIPIKCVVVLAAMDENSEGIEEDAPLYQQYTGTVQSLIADIRTQLNTEAAARQAADNTLQSNINSEASTRAATDQNLQAQISQIVAPSGEAPSAAEVQNARVGADGVTYSTLGEAIRANDSQLKSAFDEEMALLDSGKTLIITDFVNGTWSSGALSTAAVYNYRVSTQSYLSFARDITLVAKSGYTMRISLFDDSGSYITGSQKDSLSEYSVPAGQNFSLTVKNTANETTKAKADIVDYMSAVSIETGFYSKMIADNAVQDSNISANSVTLERITNKLEIVKSQNLFDESTYSDGYYTANGSYSGNTSYSYSELISVQPGDTFSFWAGNALVGPVNARFITAYDANGNAVTASGSDANVTSYTVPSGIASIRLTFAKTTIALGTLMILKGTVQPAEYIPYFEPYYKATADFVAGLTSGNNTGYMTASSAEFDNGDSLTLLVLNIAKNLVYAFSGKVTSFDTLEIGQGDGVSFGSSITVTDTDVIFTVNGNSYTQAHGLTIADYINVRLVVNDNTKGTVIVDSNGQRYTRTMGFYGFADAVYYAKNTNCVMTDCKFTVSLEDINSDIYVFGDSYTAIVESDSKWTHYLIADGYGDNVLLNACPGEDGAEALRALENLFDLGLPRFALWAIGMNDGADANGAENATWKTRIERFIEKCDILNIVPILATIPSVPSIRHEEKNAWVRASGYRYIDFAEAVGASESGVWYDGMLSTDNVHPTALGAKALYQRVIVDFPEVTMHK